jgi:SAM-dependent methyltransferase
MITDPANAAQIEYWNGPVGGRWAERQAAQDALLAPVTAAVIARAEVAAGERVVDIGCGCGDTTIELGRLVGAAGHVLGIDVSAPMLARARERMPPGLPVELVRADAAAYPFAPASVDLLFSRFGVMFFAAPARAFAHLRRALKPGGRLIFVCFRAREENPWMTLPLEAALRHVPPPPPVAPDAPGPFAFADAARVRRILDEAGFGDVAVEQLDIALDIAQGCGLEAAVRAAMLIGPASGALAGQPPAVRQQVAASIRDALAPHQQGERVPLAAAMWVVTARA